MHVEPLKLLSAGTSRLIEKDAASNSAAKSFADIFSDALNQVNQLQLDSEQASMDLATGKLQDVSQVVIATQKATLALQLTIQVRNKVVEAYQEIMRMQV